jgi:hypothetical protein
VNPGPVVSSSSSLSTILFSHHLQHRQSSPENETLQEHFEACCLKDLRLCPLKSVIIVFEFSRIQNSSLYLVLPLGTGPSEALEAAAMQGPIVSPSKNLHVVVLPPNIHVSTVVIRYLIEPFMFLISRNSLFLFPHPLVSICLHLAAYLLASQYYPQARLRMGFTKVWLVHNNTI